METTYYLKKVEDRIIEKFTNLIQRYKDKDQLYLTNSDLSMPRGEWESTKQKFKRLGISQDLI